MKRLLTAACITVLAVITIPAAKAADGKALFEKDCAKCHGKDGKGHTKIGHILKIKDFTDAKVQASFKDEDAAKAITKGIRSKEGKLRMKAITGLKPDEVKELIKYVRTFKDKK
jgi:mono/diheme cytochrome c family protein